MQILRHHILTLRLHVWFACVEDLRTLKDAFLFFSFLLMPVKKKAAAKKKPVAKKKKTVAKKKKKK